MFIKICCKLFFSKAFLNLPPPLPKLLLAPNAAGLEGKEGKGGGGGEGRRKLSC